MFIHELQLLYRNIIGLIVNTARVPFGTGKGSYESNILSSDWPRRAVSHWIAAQDPGGVSGPVLSMRAAARVSRVPSQMVVQCYRVCLEQ